MFFAGFLKMIIVFNQCPDNILLICFYCPVNQKNDPDILFSSPDINTHIS